MRANRPPHRASSPAMHANRPANRAPSPAMHANRPANRAPSPAIHANRPANRASSPATDARRPANRASSPAMDAKRPPYRASSQAVHANRPPDRASSPAKDAKRPPDRASSQTVHANRPPDRASSPAMDAKRTATYALSQAIDEDRGRDCVSRTSTRDARGYYGVLPGPHRQEWVKIRHSARLDEGAEMANRRQRSHDPYPAGRCRERTLLLQIQRSALPRRSQVVSASVVRTNREGPQPEENAWRQDGSVEGAGEAPRDHAAPRLRRFAPGVLCGRG